MFALYLLLLGSLAALMWYAWRPASFRKHVKPRLLGFLVGWGYRFMPRPRLTECHVLTDRNSVPTISRVRVNGCLHKVWLKMSHGDDLELWRSWATNLAQSHNAGDCKINGYRRPKLTQWRVKLEDGRPVFTHNGEMKDCWRWLEIEFMKSNPFSKVVSYEFIDFYRDPVLAETEGNPVGMRRDGKPYRLNVERHLVVFAMTQWGKSNAERTMIYANKDDVAAGLRENWMIDLGRGVEAEPMQGQLARCEYGLQGPEKVLQFVMQVKATVELRRDKMRQAGVTHYWELPNPKDRRRIDLYVDEWLGFEDPEYAQVKNGIYRAFAAILNRGAAAGVIVYAFSQHSKKDKFELRDHFNETWLGAMKTRAQVAMAMGEDAWDRGGSRSVELPGDLRGVFLVDVENGRTLEDIRVALTPIDVVRDLPDCPHSSVWPLSAPFRGYWPTTPPMPPDSLTAAPVASESEPDQLGLAPEPEHELVSTGGRLTDLG
jgi:hypothetical protein